MEILTVLDHVGNSGDAMLNDCVSFEHKAHYCVPGSPCRLMCWRGRVVVDRTRFMLNRSGRIVYCLRTLGIGER